jgi:hypothetical protein
MDVPAMLGVDAAYGATVLGGLLLLAVAMWWSWAGDGIEVPRESWPGTIRTAAVAGWALFVGGLLVQLAAYLAQLGAARWPGGAGGH